MKVIDTRDQTTMEGMYVATLPANKDVFPADMQRYYKLKPNDRAYDIMSRALPYDRLVLQRGGGVDKATGVENEYSYYIIPKYDFYKVEE